MTYYLDNNYTGIKFPVYLTKKNKTPLSIQRKIAMNAGIEETVAKNMDLKQLNAEIGKHLRHVFKERPIVKFYPPNF